MQIKFKPHHFLCALCFQGAGYSPTFIANFQSIMDYLNTPQGEVEEITITSEADSICSPCPSRSGKSCKTQEKINKLDQQHAEALKINAGEKITWQNAKKLIKENITIDKFHKICADCSWKSYGICQKTIEDFLKRII